MFDIGGWEFLVIAVLAIVIIGPKDLPATIRMVTTWLGRLRGFARDFQSGLDDIAREAGIDDVKNQITDGMAGGSLTDGVNSIRKDLEDAVDPHGEISDSFDSSAGDLDGDREDEDDEEAARRQEAADVEEYDDDDFGLDLDEENDEEDVTGDTDNTGYIDDTGDTGDQKAVSEPEPEPKTGT